MKAEEVYVDPSALAKLYIREPASRDISAWRAKLGGSLPFTHHGRSEIINAICRAVFVGSISNFAAERALDNFTQDVAEGRLHQSDLLWRSALNRAADLSQQYTPTFGTRSADILHIACALELNCRYFLTLDDRQRRLAVTLKLRPVELAT